MADTPRLALLQQYLAEDPSDPFLYHALGLEYLQAGELGRARTYFEQVLERFPGYVGSYYHLGKLLERMDEQGAAEDVYRRGIEQAQNVGESNTLRELRAAFAALTAGADADV